MMPVMGGLDALRAIRQTPGLHDLQVLILSGENDEGRVRDVISLGVLDFLLKPVGDERTKDRLRIALETLRFHPRMPPAGAPIPLPPINAA